MKSLAVTSQQSAVRPGAWDSTLGREVSQLPPLIQSYCVGNTDEAQLQRSLFMLKLLKSRVSSCKHGSCARILPANPGGGSLLIIHKRLSCIDAELFNKESIIWIIIVPACNKWSKLWWTSLSLLTPPSGDPGVWRGCWPRPDQPLHTPAVWESSQQHVCTGKCQNIHNSLKCSTTLQYALWVYQGSRGSSKSLKQHWI